MTPIRQPEIFRMTADDLDVVVALEASLQNFPWTRGNFADSLASGHEMHVLRLFGDVVGFSVVVSILDEAHLLVIGVDRRHQRCGHGARLLRQVIETARAGGAARLLQARIGLVSARATIYPWRNILRNILARPYVFPLATPAPRPPQPLPIVRPRFPARVV